MSYGIAHGKIGNIVGMYSVPVDEDTKYDGPWVSEVSREEVINCFTGWEPEVQELITVSLLMPHVGRILIASCQ